LVNIDNFIRRKNGTAVNRVCGIIHSIIFIDNGIVRVPDPAINAHRILGTIHSIIRMNNLVKNLPYHFPFPAVF
jgi:hypothetical protein